MSQSRPGPDPAIEQGPLSPAGVRMLKIAIVVMGVMIVLGLFGIIARMFYLASTRPSPTIASSTVLAEGRLSLPSGAVVKSTTISGDRLALQYDAPAGSGFVVLDLASGRVISRWRIEPELPK